MLTVGRFSMAAKHVIAIITHAFSVMLFGRMWTTGDSKNFLFGVNAVAYSLIYKITDMNLPRFAIGVRQLSFTLKSVVSIIYGVILLKVIFNFTFFRRCHRFLRIKLILLEMIL